MGSDWDEIKRLAADFQKVQLTSTLQKLSERNCIEIVSLLIEKKLIDVIFTNDGKEYVTSSHIESEILDELYCNGGRINLVELAKTLNVDLSKIELHAEKIAKQDEGLHLLLGQIIDENYTQRIASEINEKLHQNGEISVSDLTVQFDLPSDFILKYVMEKYIGTVISGKQDPKDNRFFFTKSYIARCKAKLRGALTAITRPTPVSALLAQADVKERIFHSLIEELCLAGTVTSRTPGAQYIPHIYTKTQVEWINTIYKREGYLEHDSVLELGVSDAKSFIQRQLPNEQLTHLKKCTIGSRIIEQVESEIDECIATGKYLDVTTVAPPIMTDDDLEQLLDVLLDATKQKSILRLGSTLLTHKFLDGVISPCHEIMKVNIKAAVDSGKYQQYAAEKLIASGKREDIDFGAGDVKADKREDRRKKAASGKAGGGAQGRETKTKSTKKHFRGGAKGGGHDSDSDNDNDFGSGKSKSNVGLELISIKEIIKCLKEGLEKEELEDSAKQLSQHFYPLLNKSALIDAQKLFESSLQNNNQSRRQTHAALQEKLNVFLGDIRLYEKGLKLMTPDIQAQLVKYLLKSLGTDIFNELAMYVAQECGIHQSETQLSAEQRNKIVQDCSHEYKSSLAALNKALVGTSIEDFLTASETTLQACSMILKKIDKKKDRILIHSHKLGLLDQLAVCTDPALVLHLAALILFTTVTQNMIHASGRHVSSLLVFLKSSLNEGDSKYLTTYHDLVLKVLASEPETEQAKEAIAQLQEMIPKVKEIAKNFKKAGVHAE